MAGISKAHHTNGATMNFKNWLLNEEIFPNKTATVYHRTRELKNISRILSKGFSSGGGSGCLYGCGLYTTFDLKSQFNDYMSRYGEYIVKFKVTNLENYLITPINVAKYILGKDYKISDQFKRITRIVLSKERVESKSLSNEMILRMRDKRYEEDLQEYDQRQATEQYSSDFFKKLYDEYRNNSMSMFNKFPGAIYYGRNDGYCLLKYEPVNDSTITMLGYAQAAHNDLNKMNELLNNQGWITSTDKEKIKNIWQRPTEKRTNVEIKDDIKKLKEYAQNNLFKFKKLLDKLPDLNNQQIHETLELSNGNPKILKMLMSHQKLNKQNVYDIINGGFEQIEELAEILGSDNIEMLNDEDVKYSLMSTNNRAELEKIIDVILKYKKNKNSAIAFYLLYYTSNEKDVAETLGEKVINKLSGWEVFELLSKENRSTTSNMKEILSRESINSLEPHHVKSLIKTKIMPFVGLEHNQKWIYYFDKLKETLETLGPENINKLKQKDLEEITAELSYENKKIIKGLLGDYGYEF